MRPYRSSAAACLGTSRFSPLTTIKVLITVPSAWIAKVLADKTPIKPALIVLDDTYCSIDQSVCRGLHRIAARLLGNGTQGIVVYPSSRGPRPKCQEWSRQIGDSEAGKTFNLIGYNPLPTIQCRYAVSSGFKGVLRSLVRRSANASS